MRQDCIRRMLTKPCVQQRNTGTYMSSTKEWINNFSVNPEKERLCSYLNCIDMEHVLIWKNICDILFCERKQFDWNYIKSIDWFEEN